MDYRVQVAGLGHSEEYQAKAEESDRAIEAALKWFLEEHGNCSAEEYRLFDDAGNLLKHGKVGY